MADRFYCQCANRSIEPGAAPLSMDETTAGGEDDNLTLSQVAANEAMVFVQSGRAATKVAIQQREIESLRSRVTSLERERDTARKREEEGFAAHLASFSALQAVSMLTDLDGEVDDYQDVVRAVERLRAARSTSDQDPT